MKLAIAIFPPKEVQNVANSYRKRYDPRYSLIPPHLTLKPAFTAAKEQLEEIIHSLRQVAEETEPIPLHIHKVSHFHPTNNVIYLAVKDEPRLTELQRRLNQPPHLQHEQKYPFIPHITIGQQMSNDELHDVYSRLRMQLFDFRFTVAQFHLLHERSDGSWDIYETFPLQGKK